jgi:hypothetical protein
MSPGGTSLTAATFTNSASAINAINPFLHTEDSGTPSQRSGLQTIESSNHFVHPVL